jgi:hypothetical protein
VKDEAGEGRRKIDPKKKTTKQDETESVLPQRVKKGTVYGPKNTTSPKGYKGRHEKDS